MIPPPVLCAWDVLGFDILSRLEGRNLVPSASLAAAEYFFLGMCVPVGEHVFRLERCARDGVRVYIDTTRTLWQLQA